MFYSSLKRAFNLLVSRRIKTPPLIQMEATECGAVALAIVMGYYKCFIPIEEIRQKCGVNRNGSNALNIMRAARDYGMSAQGAEVEDITTVEENHFPLIAFWEFNHFVVIEEIEGDSVFINDPAQGRRRLSLIDFNKAFTGVVILVKPAAGFKEGGTHPYALSPLKPALQPYKPLLVFLLALAIAAVIPAIIIPGFSKIFIDDILTKQLSDWFRPLLAGMAVIGLIAALLSWLQQWLLLRLNVYFSSWLTTRFVWHILNLPFAFFESRHSGDILLRLKSIYNLSQLFSAGLSTSLLSGISVLFYMLTMAFISLQLTLIVTLITSLIILINIFFRPYLSATNHLLLQRTSELTAVEIGGLRSMESLKASGHSKNFLNIRSNAFAKTMQERQKLTSYEMVISFSIQSLTAFLSILIMGWGSLMIMNGNLTIGTLITFLSLMTGVTVPLSTLANLSTQLYQLKSSLARLKDTFNYQPIETIDPNNNTKVKIKSHHLSIKAVSFSYSASDKHIVSEVNLTIPEKTTWALIGKSGSGKSTLAAIIAGPYPPSQGSVLIGGVDLKRLSQKQRSELIAFVDSQSYLFEGTLYDNLTLFQSALPEKQIREVIKLCALEDAISSLGGLYGHVAENGLNLSGGQRQRIEIARALLQGSKILILDEATSALDPILEDRLLTSLKELDLTLIMITHRLNTVRSSTQIIVMDQGAIVEQGSHEQLIQKDGLYQQLVMNE